jgi:hypothetical protein
VDDARDLGGLGVELGGKLPHAGGARPLRAATRGDTIRAASSSALTSGASPAGAEAPRVAGDGGT